MDWNIIDSCIQKKSLLTHMFYQAWSSGQLTKEDLQFYAGQYYALETTFPRLLSRVHSACDNPVVRQGILENLIDEERGEHNHRELWLQFAEGLGLSREATMHAELHPKTKQCIDTLMELAADPNPVVGLAALYAYESQLPEVSKSKIAGLKNFYGIEDPRTVQFFEVHKDVDAWHSEQEKVMLAELGATVDVVKPAAEKACEALLGILE